jgi:DNA-binding MarR family transcriptional regulator
LPQTQLANELDVGKVALGSFIDRLENAGFVVRKIDPIDRRVNRVHLTGQAQKFLGEIQEEIENFDAKILREVEEEELQATSRTLQAMKRNLLALYRAKTPDRPMADAREREL